MLAPARSNYLRFWAVKMQRSKLLTSANKHWDSNLLNIRENSFAFSMKISLSLQDGVGRVARASLFVPYCFTMR